MYRGAPRSHPRPKALGFRDRSVNTVEQRRRTKSVLTHYKAGIPTFDLSRFYITKNEVQNFTDSASIFAVNELDGSTAGITRAETAAKPLTQSGTNPNLWAFGTDGLFQSVNVTFATELDGTYLDGAAVIGSGSAVGYRFARVTATVSVPIYFAAIFPNVGVSQNIGASSIAGQGLVTGQSDGIFPFSPDAHNPNDPEFGFLRGAYYTMWYDKPTGNFDGPSNPNLIQGRDGDWYIGCPADLAAKGDGFQPGESSPSLHGYIDMKNLGPSPKSGGANLIRDVIHGIVDFDETLDIGEFIDPEPGTKTSARVAVQDRVSDPTWGDTDSTTAKYYNTAQVPNGPFPYDSTFFTPDVDTMNNTHRVPGQTYFAPPGNNRRIVNMPVNDSDNGGLVVGWAAFLLPPEPCQAIDWGGNKPGTPCCAEYIGPGVGGGGGGGADFVGLFRIMLFR